MPSPAVLPSIVSVPCVLSSVVSGLLAALILAGSPISAQNCQRTSIGLDPIDDLGTRTYQSFQGGLYPGGVNVPVAGHAAAGQAAVQAIQPLDSAGLPDANGKIVLVSIGMSNTTQEFQRFVLRSNADPQRSASVVVVDGAQGGQDARKLVQPNAPFWTNVDARLAAAKVTPQQVQVAWIKEAVARPTTPFPQHAVELQGLLGDIARILKQRYPNVRIAFLSSRIYAGYATTTLNPEPYAYEGGFAVKWLIEAQINGDPRLNHDPSRGAVQAPWLAWGPYLWADGLRPRSDGLTWSCGDFAADGTHPGPSGRDKVAGRLDAHFRENAFAKPWYRGPAGPIRASVLRYGQGCAGASGTPQVNTPTTPYLGNPDFVLGLAGAHADVPAILLWSFGQAQLPLVGACTLLIDPSTQLPALALRTDRSGRVRLNFAIPGDPRLTGGRLFLQWCTLDPGGTLLPGAGRIALSGGVQLVLGAP